jgi:hypothetical protein
VSLFANGTGNYQTVGHDGSATENGTQWVTQDSCDGTLFTVTQGSITINDFPHKRTFVLTAGHQFLVHPGRGG